MARSSPSTLLLLVLTALIVAAFYFTTTSSWPARTRQGRRLGPEWAFIRHPENFFLFYCTLVQLHARPLVLMHSYAYLASEGWDWQRAPNPLDPHPIVTNSDGPVWARNLTRRWQWSRLINFAVDGATVDNSVIPDAPLERMDMQGQINTFMRYFSPPSSSPSLSSWDGTNAVAAFEFGTNDVGHSFRSAPTSHALEKLYTSIGQSYISALTKLYDAGMRAFVFSSVLPLDRADMGRGTVWEISLRDAVRTFNRVVLKGEVASWCKEKEKEKEQRAVCVFLDTYALADVAMDYPDVYGFTQPYGYCSFYAARKNAEPDLATHPSCAGPLRAYVWRDFVHPSYAFHELWADLYEDTIALLFGSS